MAELCNAAYLDSLVAALHRHIPAGALHHHGRLVRFRVDVLERDVFLRVGSQRGY